MNGQAARLENRVIVELRGSEAQDFLQGIVTNDIMQAGERRAVYAGLLAPQGKLLFDFFVIAFEGGYLVEIERALLADFTKRLHFYKLRADVEIKHLPDAVVAAGEGTGEEISYADPRCAKMGMRAIHLQGEGPSPDPQALASWQARRIACGLPQGLADFTYGDCFPHDIAMDQLNGIGFQKGCYVGQEVVSRMQHRGTARKRPMIVTAACDLPAPPVNIEADGVVIGRLGSVAANRGLAEIRLDRAQTALEKGATFTAGDCEVVLARPFWASYGEAFPTASIEHDS